jgi:ABC-type multidrug transport system fused ATPase/permease subunit
MNAESDAEKGQSREGLSAWREMRRLARYLGDQRASAVIMLFLGAGAALAETTGISFAVIFLFTLLGQNERLMASEGLLGDAFRWVGGVFGAEPFLIAGFFFTLILINAALIYAYQVITAVMLNRVAERMRDIVHERYVTVGYSWLQKKEQGALVHTLATDTWTVADAFFSLARIGVNLCAAGVFMLGLFALSWEIGLTAVASGLAVFFLLRLLAAPIRRYGDETLAANRILAERMLVSLHGMRTLRAFAQEDYLLRVFNITSSKVRRLAIRKEKLKALTGPLGEVASLGALIAIALIANAAGVEVATIVASVMLLFRLQPHLREFDANRLALAGMAAALRNVRETLDREGKPWPTDGKAEFAGLAREIRFESVTFSHDSRRAPSLSGVSFSIMKGERTLISGPSGSGKTTIINLLLRLYEPASGQITVDGVDLKSIARKSFLERVAVAGQDVDLIEGTIAQNLRLADREASIAEIRDVCAAVEILNEIEAAPGGIDAPIGAQGFNFSGGQRQRIGLARALLRRPEILILDEAMSALEPAMEQRIMARIAERMKGVAIIMVSHRAGAETMADRVINVRAGRIVDGSNTVAI